MYALLIPILQLKQIHRRIHVFELPEQLSSFLKSVNDEFFFFAGTIERIAM
jgi:hypothetical protein